MSLHPFTTTPAKLYTPGTIFLSLFNNTRPLSTHAPPANKYLLRIEASWWDAFHKQVVQPVTDFASSSLLQTVQKALLELFEDFSKQLNTESMAQQLTSADRAFMHTIMQALMQQTTQAFLTVLSGSDPSSQMTQTNHNVLAYRSSRFYSPNRPRIKHAPGPTSTTTVQWSTDEIRNKRFNMQLQALQQHLDNIIDLLPLEKQRTEIKAACNRIFQNAKEAWIQHNACSGANPDYRICRS